MPVEVSIYKKQRNEKSHLNLQYKQGSMGNQCCPQKSSGIKAQNYMVETSAHEITVLSLPENKFQDPVLESSVGSGQPNVAEEGTIMMPDGSVYTGFIKGGVPHGQGREFHEGGDQYIGNFVQGLKQGQGTYRFANGALYTGQFRNGEMEGEGKISWPNGDYYQGGFKNNIINGYGKYYSKKNNSYFQGSYLDGKKHGPGKITSDKSVLSGYWEHGEFKFKKMVPYQPV